MWGTHIPMAADDGRRRADAEQVSQESRKGRRQDGKTAPGANHGPATRTEASAPAHAGKDASQARDGAATAGGRQIMSDLRRLWKHGNHQPTDAYNSHVEETEGKGDEDPLTGPLAVAVHEVEPGEADPRAYERGAAFPQHGPDSASRVEVPHPSGGHDACIPCDGRHERGEGGSHAFQADPVDGGAGQSNHPRDPHPVHGILGASADRSPATPGEEPQTAAQRTAAAAPGRTVKSTTGEPSSAPKAMDTVGQGTPLFRVSSPRPRKLQALRRQSHHWLPKLRASPQPPNQREDRNRPQMQRAAAPRPDTNYF